MKDLVSTLLQAPLPIQFTTPPPPATGMGAAFCRGCGHGATLHEHYRKGADCAGCPCRRMMRRRLAWLRG